MSRSSIATAAGTFLTKILSSVPTRPHENFPAPCDPMNAPVSPDHPPFTLSWLSAFHRGVSQLDDSCAVIGVNQILKSRLCSGKGTGLQAIHCLQFGSPSVHACLDIPLKTANVSNLLRQSQPFFAGAYCLFCRFLISNLLNHRNHQRRWTTLQ